MTAIDTIYAVSTAQGKAAVAVIRVSGPAAYESLSALTKNKSLPKPREAVLRSIFDAENRQIDDALVITFAAPSSFTGENVVEYQLHGGWSVIQSLLHFLGAQQNHRMAQPGEFTRRAFENNKLDLTEAEAIADLIDAETEAQRLQALQQLSGSLEKIYEGWKNELAHILAFMEADLDFSDQDLPDDILLKTKPDLTRLTADIASHLDDNRRGERLRSGLHIAILGAPNAGKSSLLNALTNRNAAIVSATAGTTRDIVETHLDIGGFPVILADTAGLRAANMLQHDQADIEAEGIRRALEKGEGADLKILLFDGTEPPDTKTLSLFDDRSITVYNKSDLKNSGDDGLNISVKTGEGLEKLLQLIAERLKLLNGPQDKPVLTRARHREALLKTKEALERSTKATMPELAAEDIRLAVRHLGSITGRVDVEDLLDMIFRDFCIGK